MTYFGDDLSGVSLGVYDNKATISSLDKNNSGFSKLSINSETIDLSSNSGIMVNGDFNVDTINENTDTSGVTIEQVLLKDQNVTAHTVSAQNYAVGSVNFISASRQGNFMDLEVKNSSNTETILLTGDGGNISINGTLSTDTISEKTSATGVTIDSVLLKDNIVTANTISAQNYAVGSVNFISAARQGNFRDLEVKSSSNNETVLITGDTGDISSNGLLTSVSIKTGNTTIQGTLDVSQNATFDNKVIINGELIFNSTATKITSTNTDVSDNLIVLNSGYYGNNINDTFRIIDVL